MGAPDERWLDYAKRSGKDYEEARKEFEATLERGKMYSNQEYNELFFDWIEKQMKSLPRPVSETNPENWA